MAVDRLPDDAGGNEDAEAGWTTLEDADDWLGQLIAISRAGVSMGITLTVPGGLVSGLLCPSKEYFEATRAIMKGAWSGEFPDFMNEIFDDRLARDDAPGVFTIGFIHLKDARVYTGGARGVPGNGGVYWRGRLDAVSGWSLGVLTDATD